MPLALGRAEVYFNDDSARFLDDVNRTIRLALLDTAETIATTIARSPATPELTGALKDSIRVAPPGYSQDDTPLVVRAGRPDPLNDPPLSLNADATRSNRATLGEALAGHRAAQAAAGIPADLRQGDQYELVQPTATGYHTWVGSFIYYAWWVHQGYFNKRAGREIAGRPYITRVAQPGLAALFPDNFRARWLGVRYRGA